MSYEPVEISVTTERILIALCQIAWLAECGKDISRCDDFTLIKNIAEYEKIPEIWEGAPY